MGFWGNSSYNEDEQDDTYVGHSSKPAKDENDNQIYDRYGYPMSHETDWWQDSDGVSHRESWNESPAGSEREDDHYSQHADETTIHYDYQTDEWKGVEEESE